MPIKLKTPSIFYTNEETRTLKPLKALYPKYSSYTNSDTFALYVPQRGLIIKTITFVRITMSIELGMKP